MWTLSIFMSGSKYSVEMEQTAYDNNYNINLQRSKLIIVMLGDRVLSKETLFWRWLVPFKVSKFWVYVPFFPIYFFYLFLPLLRFTNQLSESSGWMNSLFPSSISPFQLIYLFCFSPKVQPAVEEVLKLWMNMFSFSFSISPFQLIYLFSINLSISDDWTLNNKKTLIIFLFLFNLFLRFNQRSRRSESSGWTCSKPQSSATRSTSR